MKNIKNILTLLVVALVGLSLTACSEDDLDTNQYQGGISLNAFGPNPVMRGGTLRFVGSNLDQIASIQIPGISAITNYEVVKAGIPSEIRVTIPKDGPEVGIITMKTKDDKTITTLNELTYIEGIEFTGFTPAAAMPGDVIKIEGDYLNLIYSLAFADDVLVSSNDFVAQDRYFIEVRVPEEAKTGKLKLYTADLTIQRTKEEEDNLEYQIIVSDEALEIGLPTVTQMKARNTAEPMGNILCKAGETILIYGSYLNIVEDVTIGGVSAIYMQYVEGKGISCMLPLEAPDGDIMLVCKSGVEVPIGTLTTVKPSECVATPNPVKAGKSLTINGKDMNIVSSVEFPTNVEGANANGGEITVSDDKVVVKSVPANAVDGNMLLIMANGMSVEVPFTLVKPTVTGYDNTSVSAGGALTIKGTDLDLVKTVKFGESDVVNVEGTADAITLTVPMNAQSGVPTLTLANGTTVANVPTINIEEALFCYATTLPSEEDEIKAGNSMTITVSNGDKLTGVEMNGEKCQWILTGEEKNQLIIGIPESAKAKSTLRLISSNGEISYSIAVIPATSVSKTVWKGLTQLTWGVGGRVIVPAAAFEGVPAGAILTVSYTQVDQQWDQAQFNYGDWTGINFNESGDGVVTFNQTLVPTDIYGWFTDGILNRETSMILTQEILNNIQAKKADCGDEGQTGCGIIIQGSGLTFSKVTISYENSLETTIWEGNEDLSDGHQPYIGSDGGAEFIEKEVKAGQTIRFYIEPTEEGWWFEVFEGHWGPQYGKWDGNNTSIAYGSKGAVELVLTQDMIDAALTQKWWGGIFVVQGKVKLTKVTVE